MIHRRQFVLRTYTNYRRRISVADLELPARLARAAGVPHQWHRPGRIRAEAERAYDEHSGGESVGVDRGCFARRQWDFAREGDSVLREDASRSAAAATYALLLGLPENVRASGQHQRDLVARLVPALAEFPFNPPEATFGRLSRLWYRLRARFGAR